MTPPIKQEPDTDPELHMGMEQIEQATAGKIESEFHLDQENYPEALAKHEDTETQPPASRRAAKVPLAEQGLAFKAALQHSHGDLSSLRGGHSKKRKMNDVKSEDVPATAENKTTAQKKQKKRGKLNQKKKLKKEKPHEHEKPVKQAEEEASVYYVLPSGQTILRQRGQSGQCGQVQQLERQMEQLGQQMERAQYLGQHLRLGQLGGQMGQLGKRLGQQLGQLERLGHLEQLGQVGQLGQLMQLGQSGRTNAFHYF